jgi:FkbM family methyltransferase
MRAAAVGAVGWLAIVAILAPAPALGALRQCTPSEARRVRDDIGDITAASKCPQASWKPRFQASSALQKAQRDVVILDIGCNKGFDAVNSLRLFTQSERFDAARWARATRFRCGVCAQCRTNAPITAPERGMAVSLHCIEPLPSNYEAVRRAATALRLTEHGLKVVHGALTNWSDAEARGWRATFPVMRGWRARLPTGWKLQGAEQVGIDVNPLCPDCASESVPLLVLDDYVGRNRLRHIDVLSMDTEGNDALVLAGSARTLRRKVRYLEFEYGTTGQWERIRLPAVLEPLERTGFVCYWLGKRKLWRITGCWHPDYATVRVWANIGCVHRREFEWVGIMEDIFNATVPLY